MRQLKWLLCLTLTTLLLTSGASAFASGSRPKVFQSGDDRAILRACEETLIQWKADRERLAAMAEKSEAQTKLIAALEAKIPTLEALVANLKEQIAKHAAMDAISTAQKESYERSIADFQKQFDRLVKERDQAVHAKWTYGIIGALIGATLAILASNR